MTPNLQLQSAIDNIIEKYGNSYTLDEILIAVENAISTVLGKTVLIDWGGDFGGGIGTPTIYCNKRGYWKPFVPQKMYFWQVVAKYLPVHLAILKTLRGKELTKPYKKAYKNIVRSLTIATITAKLDNNNVLAVIDGSNIPCLLKKEDQPKKERNYYDINQKLFCFIKRIDYDADLDSPVIFLSRNSKSLTEELARYLLADRINNFYKKNNRYPVVKCTKRIPGVFSVLAAEIMIPKTIMQQITTALWGEAINVVFTEKN